LHSGFRRVGEDGRTLADFAGAVQSVRMVNETLARPGAREGGDPPSRWSVGDAYFVHAPDPRVLEWWIYALDGRLERIVRVADAAPWPPPPGEHRMGLFTVDIAGRLWVELPSPDGGAEGLPWWVVFDASGEPRHALRLPRASQSSPGQLYPVMEI